jgi:hypothetical protein
MTPPPAAAQLAEVSDYVGLLAIFSLVGLVGGITFFGVLIDE